MLTAVYDSTKIKDKSMQVEIKKLPKSQIELTITHAYEELGDYLARAARRLAQVVELPGFRKGKAPYDIVKQRLGEQAILEEAAEDIIKLSYVDTVKNKDLAVVGRPEVNVQKMTPGNDFVFRAVATLWPEVQLADFDQIKVVAQAVKVAAEEIDKVLQDLRKMRAKEKLVERAIQPGDKAILDFEVAVGGVPIEGGGQRVYPVMVGAGKMVPGFEEEIIGMNKGEEKSFELKFPAEYFRKDLAGRRADFKVSVKNVYQVELPETNDEFLKSLGEFRDLAHLKEELGKNLEHEKQYEESLRQEKEILQRLVAKSKFDELPDLFIDNEQNLIFEEAKRSIENQGFNFADYLNSLQKNEDEFKAGLKHQAGERVKAAVLIRAQAKQAKIEVSDEEVDAQQQLILNQYAGQPKILERIQESDYRDLLKGKLVNQKTIVWLKEKLVKV